MHCVKQPKIQTWLAETDADIGQVLPWLNHPDFSETLAIGEVVFWFLKGQILQHVGQEIS